MIVKYYVKSKIFCLRLNKFKFFIDEIKKTMNVQNIRYLVGVTVILGLGMAFYALYREISLLKDVVKNIKRSKLDDSFPANEIYEDNENQEDLEMTEVYEDNEEEEQEIKEEFTTVQDLEEPKLMELVEVEEPETTTKRKYTKKIKN